jgi:hypothetical protein
MLQAIVQSHEALSNFLSLFRDAFQNRPQYRHFQAYVLGLIIYLGSRNLAGLSRAIPDGKSPCSLYWFCQSKSEPFDHEKVSHLGQQQQKSDRQKVSQVIIRSEPIPPPFSVACSPSRQSRCQHE